MRPTASLQITTSFRQSGTDTARGIGVELVLELPCAEAVDAAYERIHSNVESAGGKAEPVSDRPWGLRDFSVIDPDGYYIRNTHR